jgi:hypothetical protein
VQILTGNVESRSPARYDSLLSHPVRIFSSGELRVPAQILGGGNVGYDVNAVLHDAIDLR